MMDILIVMTRFPREGKTKTRLIPALGAAGAMEMHNRLARHAVARASSFARVRSANLQVHLADGSPADGRKWLGKLDFHRQAAGDLGERMQAAVERAFAGGARRVAVIGTDCPELDESTLAAAFDALADADCVFGPAADGGYYLVGLAKPAGEIFHNISWGGPEVLAESLAAADRAGLRWKLLGILPDVDFPADLPAAERALAAGKTLSVIVPTLNEEAHLAHLMEALQLDFPHEIIVADGGSTDATVAIARGHGPQIVSSAPGRAAQMNAAAALATGEHLLFLHADTVPPRGFPGLISRLLADPQASAGAFRFQLAGDLACARLIEIGVAMRCRLFAQPYGDQGLFVGRWTFQQLGGFPAWPVLEDLHFVRQLKRVGKIRIAAEPATTSPRRWETGGVVRTFLRHQLILAAYHGRVAPEEIARLRL